MAEDSYPLQDSCLFTTRMATSASILLYAEDSNPYHLPNGDFPFKKRISR
ncbi:hypothetical protein I3760_03G222000 [Carya illinoinensis]|nr:hypothetical protein I3760_03G222000 [Carya illinoinensis]